MSIFYRHLPVVVSQPWMFTIITMQFLFVCFYNPNALQNIEIRNSEEEAQAWVFSEAFQVTPMCSQVENPGSGLELTPENEDWGCQHHPEAY